MHSRDVWLLMFDSRTVTWHQLWWWWNNETTMTGLPPFLMVDSSHHPTIEHIPTSMIPLTIITTTTSFVTGSSQNSTDVSTNRVSLQPNNRDVDWSHSWPYILLTSVILLSLLGYVIMVVLTVCKRRLHYTTCYLITSQACVNLLNSVMIMPISTAILITGKILWWSDRLD